MRQLVIATRNKGKLKEYQELFAGSEFLIEPISNYTEEDAPETGNNFYENSKQKAEFYSKFINKDEFLIAEDSGLCIKALDDFPGIYSARYLKEFANSEDAFKDIAIRLKNKDNRAYFICVVSLYVSPKILRQFEGRLEGKIIYPPQGKDGFGYDPIFVPNGYSKSLAEFNHAEKNMISHRKKAFDQVIEEFKCL